MPKVKRPEWIEKYSGPFPQHLSNVSLAKLHEACAYALSLERKMGALCDKHSSWGASESGGCRACQWLANNHNSRVTDLERERDTLRSQADALAATLEKARCTCKREWKDQCPRCGGKLKPVTQDPGSPLNEEQFASVRAGDYYCEACTGTEARTGYKYWWESDLEWTQATCARCAALSAYRAGKEGKQQ